MKAPTPVMPVPQETMKPRPSKQFRSLSALCWAVLAQGPLALCGAAAAEPSPTLEFASPTFSVREDGREAVIGVLRKPQGESTVTVDYTAAPGTNRWDSASPGADFLTTSGTLVFGPGQTNQTFRVQILDDGFVEGDEAVLLTLSNPSPDALLGPQARAVLTIEDNEVPTWLDPTFHPGFPLAGVAPLLVQPDGKILLGGQLSNPGPEPVTIEVVVRLNRDGTQDSTFPPVKSPWPRSVSTTFVSAMALQADGKLLIGGVFSELSGTSRTNLARLNPDGSVDTTFAVSLNRSSSDSPVKAILIEPGGKIVIGGAFHIVNGVARPGLARLDSDGSLDPDSDVSEAVRRALIDYDVLLQPDGKLLVGSSCTTRLNADGSTDASFLPCDGQHLELDVRPLAVRSDGKILVQTWQSPLPPLGGSGLPGLMLLNPDGSMHQRYPFPGVNFPHDSYVISAAFGPDGSALIAGSLRSQIGLARLFSDGSLPAFQFSSARMRVAENGTIASIVVQRTGDSSAAAEVHFATSNGSGQAGQEFQVQSGTLEFAPLETTKTIKIPVLDNAELNDTKTFIVTLDSPSEGFVLGAGPSTETISIFDDEHSGSVDLDFNPALSSTGAWLRQADGKILVARRSNGIYPDPGVPPSSSVSRLNADGSPDTAFKLDVPPLPYWPGYLVEQLVAAFAAQSDGKILLGAATPFIVNGTQQDGVARIKPDGTLDPEFKADLGASNGIVRIVAVQADGKILVGENFYDANSRDHPVIVRLKSNGEPDRSFDMGPGIAGGIWTTKLTSILPQPNGEIWIAGDFGSVGGVARPGIARLNSDGSVDREFDPAFLGAAGSVTSAAVQPNGKIIAVGEFATSYGGVVRLNSDGSGDKTFNSFGAADGVSVRDLTAPVVIALQPDGRFLLAGSSFSSDKNGTLQERQGVARLNSDGTLDTSFDVGPGFYIDDVCCDLAQLPVSSILVLPNGNILAGGGFTSFGGVPRPGLVRLHGDPPLRFASISRGMQLGLNTLPGRRYALEASPDLRTWYPWHTNTATSYLLRIHEVDPGSGPRFYRAHLLGP
jgi:uncharacterized delta-60 repeat protein